MKPAPAPGILKQAIQAALALALYMGALMGAIFLASYLGCTPNDATADRTIHQIGPGPFIIGQLVEFVLVGLLILCGLFGLLRLAEWSKNRWQARRDHNRNQDRP